MRLTFEIERDDGQLDRKDGLVRTHADDLDPVVQHRTFSGFPEMLHARGMGRAHVGRDDEVGHSLIHHVITLATEDLLRGTIELDDFSARVDRDDGVEDRLSRGFQPLSHMKTITKTKGHVIDCISNTSIISGKD